MSECSRVGLEVKIYDTPAGGIRASQGTFSSSWKLLGVVASIILFFLFGGDGGAFLIYLFICCF